MKFNERNTTPDAERSDFSPSGFPAVAIICALTAILSGCTLSKPPVHSQIVTDALPLGTTIPPHWSSVTGANDVANDWLKSFNDPRLNAVVSETINNNLDYVRPPLKLKLRGRASWSWLRNCCRG